MRRVVAFALLALVSVSVAQVDQRIGAKKVPQTAQAAGDYGRILAIGDSITGGTGFEGGWRKMLQEDLTLAGIKYTFVGRRDLRHRMEQPYHEGHSGWSSTELIEGRVSEMAGNIKDWVKRYKPATVILMAGTNDKTAEAANQVAMIADILNVDPKVKVIVGLIPPSKRGKERNEIENKIRTGQIQAVEAFKRTGYTVIVADTTVGFDPETMLADPVHPNQAGYQLIAAAYRTALKQLWGF